MVPFTPRLIPAILPNLAHHVAMIQSAALRTNKLLLSVIQALPSPVEATPRAQEKQLTNRVPSSPTPTASASRQSTQSSTGGKDPTREAPSPESVTESPTASQTLTRPRGSGVDISMTPRTLPLADVPPSSTSSRPHSPVSFLSHSGHSAPLHSSIIEEEQDPFDYQATVNELTIQFLSEFEETRVAALKWLIMLHQKAPKKVCGLLNMMMMENLSLNRFWRWMMARSLRC